MSCAHNCTSCPSGGCGGCGGCHRTPLDMEERRVLFALAQTPFLPLVQYQRRASYFSPREPLDPPMIYLFSPDEPGEQTVRTAHAIQSLASRGLIAADNELPLTGCDYFPYRECAFVKQLQAQNPAHTIVLNTGSMALTAAGQDALDDLEMDML